MATYRRANQDLQELLQKLLESYHPDLIEYGVRIDLLWAYADRDEATGEIQSPAIVHNGYPAAGLCKINSLADRALGLGDVRILLDHDQWDSFNPRTQSAVLDHELEHIIIRDERDDIGRPKIKIKKHDYQIGVFNVIAERYGDHSLERMALRALFDNNGQQYFPFLKLEAVA